MFLTTSIVALSRKLSDEHAKKNEVKSANLAFVNGRENEQTAVVQAAHALGSDQGNAPIAPPRIVMNLGTYRSPDTLQRPHSLELESPSSIYSTDTNLLDARSTSQITLGSPVQSETASPGMLSSDQTGFDGYLQGPQPPPYTEYAALIHPTSSLRSSESSSRPSTGRSSSIRSRTVNSSVTASLTPSASISPHAIRIKTKGGDLKSGFAYHPALFELRVHPEQWDRFTTQVIESVKMDFKDNARMWGTAAGVAMTGAIVTSVFVGRSVKRSLQEKKVRAGLNDLSAGALGDTLDKWNESYFSKTGLFVHLELSESSLKNPDHKGRTFRMPAAMYSEREQREKKRDQRKYVLVVTQLDEQGHPAHAMREITNANPTDPGDVVATPAEIATSDTHAATAAELPVDDDQGFGAFEMPADLPAGVSLGYGNDRWAPTQGYAELDAEITALAPMTEEEKVDVAWEHECEGIDTWCRTPLQFMVTAETHARLHDEKT